MNELVKRLTAEGQIVEASRPDKSVSALKECIDRGYVHVLFQETGTELGVKLDKSQCDLESCSFENGSGVVHLEGCLTLNYDKVRVISDIHLKTLEGKGHLKLINDEEYKRALN